jgi:hypothetical protein
MCRSWIWHLTAAFQNAVETDVLCREMGSESTLPAFQPPEKRLCAGRVASSSLQRSDHLTLTGDVSFSAVEKAFGFRKEAVPRYRGPCRQPSSRHQR